MELEKLKSGSQKGTKLEEKSNAKDKEEKPSIVVLGGRVLVETEDKKFKFARSPKTNPELHPEVWDRIFRYLSRGEMITSINACPEWNQLLDSKKTTLLLPNVLPLILKYLDDPAILLCRSISKTSKQIVDQTLQVYNISSEDSFRVDFVPLPSFHLAVDEISCRFLFTSKEEVDKFIKAMGLQKHLNGDQNINQNKNIEVVSNPFLTRNINIYIETPTSPQEVLICQQFFQALYLLLSAYGHFINRLIVAVWNIMNETQEITKMIHYLHQLPNLKILELFAKSVEGEEIDVTRLPPLPSLKDLEYLDVSDVVSQSVVTLFTQTYGDQLTTLVCQGRWLKLAGIEEPVLKTLFPKLKQLRLEDINPTSLLKLSKVNWPLEILHFSTFEPFGEVPVEMKSKIEQLILDAVRNFSHTLTHLEIQSDLTKLPQPQLAADNDGDDENETTMESGVGIMPKLKVFFSEASNVGSTLFWNFLLSKCKSIEEMGFHTNDSNFKNAMEVAKPAFNELPNLEKIYFWREDENEEEVQRAVLTRAKALSSSTTQSQSV